MLYPSVTKDVLQDLYQNQGLSMMEISRRLGCSHHKIAYWMNEYKIKRRSRSEAIYRQHNPEGDPFKIKSPQTPEEYILFGLGVGLYWGEGTKSNLNAVRLGNTDPGIIRSFMVFLVHLCGVDKSRLRFGLQIFSDTDPVTALNYWSKALDINKSQFYRPIVTKSGSVGTYRNKNMYGVVTIYFGNTKLRDKLVAQVAEVAQLARARHW